MHHTIERIANLAVRALGAAVFATAGIVAAVVAVHLTAAFSAEPWYAAASAAYGIVTLGAAAYTACIFAVGRLR